MGEEGASVTGEGHRFDRKSRRAAGGSAADFDDLATHCLACANAAGGEIHLGIEDDATEPPAGQRVPDGLVDKIRKRIGELTSAVHVAPEIRTAANGGQYVVLVIPRATGIASTSNGRYFVRVGDASQPLVGDDVRRLLDERSASPWESAVTLGVARAGADAGAQERLLSRLRASGRVKPSVKEKTDDELLEHYGLVSAAYLTNLGVLLIGRAAERARLGSAPVVQAVRYDERREKVWKESWDAYTLSPIGLVDAVWRAVPDFAESYDLPDGMFRTKIPAFEEAVVRELLVNALVHRPYTQRGDIFLSLFPDRLEIVNPGRLPLGVTPRNILHAHQRRNDLLARVFHDLGLMEREGSGFDMMYDRLLASGRAAPEVAEGADYVRVVVARRIVHTGVIRLIAEADARYQLTHRERIALGTLAQGDGLTAAELADRLELTAPEATHGWIDRLLELGLARSSGRTRATRYFVPPELLRSAGLDRRTTLRRIEPYRLRALVLEDLGRYPGSSISAIHRRIGQDVPLRTLQRMMAQLVEAGHVTTSGEKRWRVYSVAPSVRGGDGGA